MTQLIYSIGADTVPLLDRVIGCFGKAFFKQSVGSNFLFSHCSEQWAIANHVHTSFLRSL